MSSQTDAAAAAAGSVDNLSGWRCDDEWLDMKGPPGQLQQMLHLENGRSTRLLVLLLPA
jgi:hypothetical protein